MLVEARRLTLIRDDRPILDQVSFDWDTGEYILIIGPNGSGKTSLLRCLIGYIHDFSGELRLTGQSIRQMDPRERARLIGYVPQSLEMDFNMDVRGFMECARYARDKRAHTKIIDECLDLTETRQFQGAYLDELSGGERQRVLIAAALAQQPKILLLDEANAHLDPRHQVDLAVLLTRLHDQDMTIAVVAHDWNAFLHLHPRVIAMQAGRVFHDGDWDSLRPRLDALYDCHFVHWQHEDQLRSSPQFRKPRP